jgi:hypothetical protein
MGNRFSDPIASISFPIIAFVAFPLLTPAAGQSATGGPQPGKIPDLNGVWSAPFTPDISKPLGHQPPFTPYGVERFKNVDEADDPLTQCLPIGPARGIQAGIMPFPDCSNAFGARDPVREPGYLSHHLHGSTEPPQRP